MEKISLKADLRTLEGRKVKKLRRDGIVPANIFGRDVKSLSIQVSLNDFRKVFVKAGETNIVDIEVGKETKPVLIHNVQSDPVMGEVLHVDFLQVDLKKKVTAEVPVELVGVNPVEKQGLGTVVQYINEIEVEALPAELPDKFEIDTSLLTEVDQMIQIKDLKVDSTKVTIEGDPESIVVKVEPPKIVKEEVVEVVTDENAAPEGEEGKENGEAADGKDASNEKSEE